MAAAVAAVWLVASPAQAEDPGPATPPPDAPAVDLSSPPGPAPSRTDGVPELRDVTFASVSLTAAGFVTAFVVHEACHGVANLAMSDIEKRNLVAQWAFDTRPVLTRFHLWLEDVQVEPLAGRAVSAHTFTPRGIARSLAVTAAATALGTKLFGHFGEGAGKDKSAYNQVKKAADAVSAYVMSEGLWYLTRTLPENHALMVSPGRGAHAQGRRDPRDGRQPAARLRARLRPSRGRATSWTGGCAGSSTSRATPSTSSTAG